MTATCNAVFPEISLAEISEPVAKISPAVSFQKPQEFAAKIVNVTAFYPTVFPRELMMHLNVLVKLLSLIPRTKDIRLPSHTKMKANSSTENIHTH